MQKVLIVDDALVVRTLMRHCVTRVGHEVVGVAGNAHDALDQFSASKPDVVILDLGLPDGQGVEVLQTMKRQAPGVRVIVYTAMCAPDVLDSVRAAGADACLQKPLTPDKLTSVLKETIASMS